MGLLDRFFTSTESIATEIEHDDKSLLRIWKDYLETVPGKKQIIERLHTDFHNELPALKKFLELELADISQEEKKESELIFDLKKIEHAQKIKRVHKLEQCIGYVETRYEYVHELVHQIHSVLISQMHLVQQLLADSTNAELFITHLKSQLALELVIIAKIEKMKTFHDLFLALLKGEHIIRTMDAKEKKLLKKMQTGVSKIFSNEISEGITSQWAITVFNAIEDNVHEGVANGMFPGYHPNIDFEFTNRPEFVVLVRESIQSLRKRKVSEQMIQVFVHLFREWYNHERD